MKRVLMMSGTVLLMVAFVFSTGCISQQVQAPEEPAMTQAQAEAAAREINEAWDNARNSGDADALADLYTDDGRRYPSDAPPVIGKEAIRASFQEAHDEYEFNSQTQIESVILAEEAMFVRGVWKNTRTPQSGGETLDDSGHWMDLRQLQDDGSWKIVETMWVRNAPPPQE